MYSTFKYTKLTVGLLALSSVFWVGCKDGNSALEKEIAKVPMQVEVLRFDQEFYNAKENELGVVKKKYPYLFPQEINDEVWLAKKKDTLFAELHTEVEKKFKNLGGLPEQLTDLFKHIKYYYPGESSKKKVITLISEVDVASKAIYADTLALVSIDTYLGADHKFYKGFPEYLRTTFEPSQILPDMAESFVVQKMVPSNDRTFLGAMIQKGKILYAKELLLPQVAEETLITYTKPQLDWCKANEAQVWRYFVDSELFYETDPKLMLRFIEPAPFTKFYLEIDAESPGRVGAWMGWQIVRSYMKNNNVTLQELFAKEAKDIFEQSKYKPKK
ncbi:MAG: gliding motility lipoprotein GldB [Flavobacteriaceae bacterium]|jgi:gliding motility-associated lipoprotein GldB|nr:gliding motility lipoprotein GldB [Flavobacteriaceae bacterium]